MEDNTCHRFWHFARWSSCRHSLNHNFCRGVCWLWHEKQSSSLLREFPSSKFYLKLKRPKVWPLQQTKSHRIIHIFIQSNKASRCYLTKRTTEARNVNPRSDRDHRREIIAIPKIEIIYFLPSFMISHSVLFHRLGFNRGNSTLDTIALSFFNENYVSDRFQFLQFHRLAPPPSTNHPLPTCCRIWINP